MQYNQNEETSFRKPLYWTWFTQTKQIQIRKRFTYRYFTPLTDEFLHSYNLSCIGTGSGLSIQSITPFQIVYATQNIENKNAGGMGGIYVNETFAKVLTCIYVVLLYLNYYIYSSLILPFASLKSWVVLLTYITIIDKQLS